MQQHNASAVIGPTSSSEGVVCALVAALYKIPVVSFAATAAALSNKIQYPYFLRNVPSDVAQAQAAASLLALINQTKVVVLYSDDTYGQVLMRHANSAETLRTGAQSSICS
jgi:ABC-type branched-subunit amino acid transport system substrate-binding protein